MAKTNPVEFLQEVRDESRKVTWPSRTELRDFDDHGV